ncbi:YwqG family protein [Paenibacillus shenyangensis]|uniref:YwqG family protein n=1 Tax=Paenibacillus sp. A9 TaxID=1284352 RepID=UPI000361C5E9|nr:YwqG family protein [Paenibacillus sp. A9]
MEYSNLLSDEELKQLMERYEVPELENYLREHQRPVVKMVRGEGGNGQTGCSRFGGSPDLPVGMEWPRSQGGEWMTLVAQLNLSQITAEIKDSAHGAIPGSLLPAQGMLYFFVGQDEPAYNIEHRVLYWSGMDTSLLTCYEPDGLTILEEEAEEPFLPYQVHAQARVEFPNYGYSEVYNLDDEEITEETAENYLLLTEEMGWEPEHVIGKMLGYGDGQHGDHEFVAASYLHTGKHTYNQEKDKKRMIQHFGGDEQKVDQEIDEMLMLLEVDSDRDIGFLWWDAGCIHFFIRKEDLLAGNFERTYCSIYSS